MVVSNACSMAETYMPYSSLPQTSHDDYKTMLECSENINRPIFYEVFTNPFRTDIPNIPILFITAFIFHFTI